MCLKTYQLDVFYHFLFRWVYNASLTCRTAVAVYTVRSKSGLVHAEPTMVDECICGLMPNQYHGLSEGAIISAALHTANQPRNDFFNHQKQITKRWRRNEANQKWCELIGRQCFGNVNSCINENALG